MPEGAAEENIPGQPGRSNAYTTSDGEIGLGPEPTSGWSTDVYDLRVYGDINALRAGGPPPPTHDPTSLVAAGQALSKARGDLAFVRNRLVRAANGLLSEGQWQGTSAEQFRVYVKGFVGSLDAVIEQLQMPGYAIPEMVRSAGEALAQTQEVYRQVQSSVQHTEDQIYGAGLSSTFLASLIPGLIKWKLDLQEMWFRYLENEYVNLLYRVRKHPVAWTFTPPPGSIGTTTVPGAGSTGVPGATETPGLPSNADYEAWLRERKALEDKYAPKPPKDGDGKPPSMDLPPLDEYQQWMEDKAAIDAANQPKLPGDGDVKPPGFDLPPLDDYQDWMDGKAGIEDSYKPDTTGGGDVKPPVFDLPPLDDYQDWMDGKAGIEDSYKPDTAGGGDGKAPALNLPSLTGLENHLKKQKALYEDPDLNPAPGKGADPAKPLDIAPALKPYELAGYKSQAEADKAKEDLAKIFTPASPGGPGKNGTTKPADPPKAPKPWELAGYDSQEDAEKARADLAKLLSPPNLGDPTVGGTDPGGQPLTPAERLAQEESFLKDQKELFDRFRPADTPDQTADNARELAKKEEFLKGEAKLFDKYRPSLGAPDSPDNAKLLAEREDYLKKQADLYDKYVKGEPSRGAEADAADRLADERKFLEGQKELYDQLSPGARAGAGSAPLYPTANPLTGSMPTIDPLTGLPTAGAGGPAGVRVPALDMPSWLTPDGASTVDPATGLPAGKPVLTAAIGDLPDLPKYVPPDLTAASSGGGSGNGNPGLLDTTIDEYSSPGDPVGTGPAGTGLPGGAPGTPGQPGSSQGGTPPMMPPPMGQPGGQNQNRETWLREDRDVWKRDQVVSTGVLGGAATGDDAEDTDTTTRRDRDDIPTRRPGPAHR